MSDTGIIIAPDRSDEDILRGLREHLQAIAQRHGVAFMGFGQRLFVCRCKDAALNLWSPIGELGDCSFAWVKDQCIYRDGVDQRYVNDTMHEVTERLMRLMVEFHAAITVREGQLYVAVPHGRSELGVDDGTWREVGLLAAKGILPFPMRG